MSNPNFSTSDWSTIANGMRTAADTYRQLAVSQDLHEAGGQRLAECFNKQAADALALAERIETEAGV